MRAIWRLAKKTKDAMLKVFRNPFFSLPIALFFFVGAYFAYTLPYGDELLFFNQWRVSPYNELFRAITILGEPYAWGIAFLILVFKRKKTEAVAFAVSGLLLIPTVHQLKNHFEVHRPSTFFDIKDQRKTIVFIPDFYTNVGKTSFPSGHGASAFALYTMLASYLPLLSNRRSNVLLLSISPIAVAFSRIFLVQHFLVDVLAGAALGLVFACLGMWLNNFFGRRSPKHEKLA